MNTIIFMDNQVGLKCGFGERNQTLRLEVFESRARQEQYTKRTTTLYSSGEVNGNNIIINNH